MKFSHVALNAGITLASLANVAASDLQDLEDQFLDLCTEGYVDCAIGGVVQGGSQSCADACGGQCCVGPGACSGNIIAKICKDGVSCMNGDEESNACRWAQIPFIYKGCHGDHACHSAGYRGDEGLKIKMVENSCQGYRACDHAGHKPGIGLGRIIGSCNADQACAQAGAIFGNTGQDLNGCCNTEQECCKRVDGVNPECPIADDAGTRTTDTYPAQCAVPATDQPTKSPTGAPTTTAPTPASWEIKFESINTNFGLNSTEQLVLAYQVGKGREIVSKLYAGGCKSGSSTSTDITGIEITGSNTTEDGSNGLDKLTLSYTFDTAKLTNSNIWYNDTATVELCQVLQLKLDVQGDEDYIITEDMRNVTIDLDLDADFSIPGNITLVGATINAVQQNTSLSEFITAIKCSGLGTAEDDSPLAPNTELKVCIKSNSKEVVIDTIVSMLIDGKNSDAVYTSLPVIQNGETSFPALTSIDWYGGEVLVTTRVPTNLFDFEAAVASIGVSGALALELSDGTRRRLTISEPSRDLQAAADADNEAGFGLSINLQPETNTGTGLDGESAIVNSVKAAASCKGFAVFGMLITSTYAFW